MRTAIVLLLAAAVTPAADPKAKLAELVKLYQAYELPVPPKDAKLYRYAPVGAKVRRPAVGFGLKPDKDGTLTRFQHGFEFWQFSPNVTTEIPLDAKRIEVREINLVMIVQFHLLGWTDLATKLLPLWADARRLTPEQALASAAWDYWFDRLRDPTVDRALIVRRMASAMRAEPDVFTGDDREMTYVDLRKSLLPSRAKPGTVEALIDEWLDISEHFFPHPNDERYDAVVRQGFNAVPALIDALTDTRVIRGTRTAYWSPSGRAVVQRVQDLATEALRQFMYDGEPFAEKDEGVGLDVKAVKKWWAVVSKANEEEYVVSRVLTAPKDDYPPNEHLLAVIRHKYPKRLPAVFRKVLTDHPDTDILSLAQAVARSSLPKETKRELLLEAVASKDLPRQRYSLMHLHEVDADEFHRRLVAFLDSLSSTPSESTRIGYREVEFYSEVCLTADAKVWAAAEKYVRRADPGIRVWWLQRMSTDQPWENEVARLRVGFIAKFLTDDAVHDPTAKPNLYPNHQHAVYPDFRAIEVRNYAAMLLSQALEVKGKPSPKWTADEWARFRDEVAKAVK